MLADLGIISWFLNVGDFEIIISLIETDFTEYCGVR